MFLCNNFVNPLDVHVGPGLSKIIIIVCISDISFSTWVVFMFSCKILSLIQVVDHRNFTCSSQDEGFQPKIKYCSDVTSDLGPERVGA
jgi:hypothetical protein